jgi:DNA-binding beta-propeller fold protein YncE
MVGPHSTRRVLLATVTPALGVLAAACSMGGQEAASVATQTAPRPASTTAPAVTPTPAKPELVYVFSNSSPHISVIDVATNRVTRTKDIPNLGVWATNDDNCYWDGKNAWLGARNPSTNDVEVFPLDLDTLEPTRRIPLGKDATTVYVGKGSRLGQLFVSKHASGQMAVIDVKTFQVLDMKDVPVNGGVACDMDVAVGSDGIERAFIPTDTGNTTVAYNTQTREVIGTYTHAAGVRPYMLTASPDGNRVWVQERTTDGQLVLDTKTMQPVKHVPTGKSAFLNSFSPDGKLSYVGHNADTRMVVVDAAALTTVKEIEVGTNAKDMAVLPSGRQVYVIATRENFVAAVNTSNWAITAKIQLPENLEFIYTPPSMPR